MARSALTTKRLIALAVVAALIFAASAVSWLTADEAAKPAAADGVGRPVKVGQGENHMHDSEKLVQATFGNGCFWCTEAVFDNVRGVYRVESGYTGGTIEDPTYREVCAGTTGHAEAVQITYDPEVVSFTELLEIF